MTDKMMDSASKGRKIPLRMCLICGETDFPLKRGRAATPNILSLPEGDFVQWIRLLKFTFHSKRLLQRPGRCLAMTDKMMGVLRILYVEKERPK
jgi:hypothetical protein